jgi:EpsI family protein
VIALVMNWIRIILIILWNYSAAKENVHGPYEIYRSAFIFLAGFIILLFINKLVESSHKSIVNKQKTSNIQYTSIYDFFSSKNILPMIGIMVVTCCYLIFWSIKSVTLKESLESFPRVINEWQGRDINTFPVQFKHGFANEELIREYVNSDGNRIFLYIGYFYQQTNDKEMVDYRYAWAYNNAKIIQFSPDHRFWVKSQKVGLKEMKIFSWFNINGKNIVNTKQAKIESLKDSLLNRKNNGSVIILLSYPEISNELVENISKTCNNFLNSEF